MICYSLNFSVTLVFGRLNFKCFLMLFFGLVKISVFGMLTCNDDVVLT